MKFRYFKSVMSCVLGILVTENCNASTKEYPLQLSPNTFPAESNIVCLRSENPKLESVPFKEYLEFQMPDEIFDDFFKLKNEKILDSIIGLQRQYNLPLRLNIQGTFSTTIAPHNVVKRLDEANIPNFCIDWITQTKEEDVYWRILADQETISVYSLKGSTGSSDWEHKEHYNRCFSPAALHQSKKWYG